MLLLQIVHPSRQKVGLPRKMEREVHARPGPPLLRPYAGSDSTTILICGSGISRQASVPRDPLHLPAHFHWPHRGSGVQTRETPSLLRLSGHLVRPIPFHHLHPAINFAEEQRRRDHSEHHYLLDLPPGHGPWLRPPARRNQKSPRPIRLAAEEERQR